MIKRNIENAYIKDMELIKKLNNIRNEHKKIISTYLSKQNNNSNNDKVKIIKYATGGELLHRGYYCPSPIYDIVIGNVKRGKLSNELTKKCTYKYGFDESNRLITVETIDKYDRKEYIWYENSTQYGVQVSTSSTWGNRISTTSKCLYNDNKITRYEFALVLATNDELTEYDTNSVHIEEYFYSEDELINILSYEYLVYEDKQYIAQKYLYELIRDENNIVTHYKHTCIQNGMVVSETIIEVQKSKQRII